LKCFRKKWPRSKYSSMKMTRKRLRGHPSMKQLMQ
jgi:hypothetical protein